MASQAFSIKIEREENTCVLPSQCLTPTTSTSGQYTGTGGRGSTYTTYSTTMNAQNDTDTMDNITSGIIDISIRSSGIL